ncbi:hypothetical protein [Saccharomonospora sp. NB11]|jgi:peptidoglycan hydrolase CwlO-like protein|uniref:hypothetical protein n=1 Tax=Saccharomonospora sp. NB11 TaxID=1642298 RepID=UPI0018D0FEDF|nr:hypothetical protein [Saccharomonospora sp. NB11]
MTRRADTRLIDQLRQNQAALAARSTTIAEHNKQVLEKISANTHKHLQSMRERAAEVEKRKAEYEKQKQEEEPDPAAKNQWLQRRESRDETFQFDQGEDSEPAESPNQRSTEVKPSAPPVPSPPPAPAAQQSAASTPAGQKSRPADDFDDDDFSNNSWLQ